MAESNVISVADLRAMLAYDPETGALTWRLHRWPELVGAPVTFDIDRGYKRFRIGRKWQRAHRVAWALMTGAWPADMVDHINGDRADNRWCNLRASDAFLNQQNRMKPERGNKAGLLGVRRHHKKFCATIRVANVEIFLGTFPTPEEAHTAYLDAKRLFHPHSFLAQRPHHLRTGSGSHAIASDGPPVGGTRP